MPRLSTLTSCLIGASLLMGCAARHFETKPINVEQVSQNLAAKDPANPKFKEYLQNHGYPQTFDTWGLDELTLLALYFHPQLDVAKAEIAHSEALEDTSALRPPPTLNGHLGHSNLRNGDANPWAYGLSVDIPVETGGKRAMITERARQQTQLARLGLAETAWQLRSQIAIDLLRYQQDVATIKMLQRELNTRDEIVAMLQKRLEKGAASSTELNREQLTQAQTRAALMRANSQQTNRLSQLAADVGLPPTTFGKLPLQAEPVEQALSRQAAVLDDALLSKQLQASALLNRIDMRRAVTQYEIAETNLRLEIAKQYPDFSISPGLAFEFGDTIWSLGISSLLSFTRQNSTHIAAAERLRDVEGAKLEAQQAHIISQLEQAYTQYTTAKANLEQSKQQLNNQQALFNKLEKQFDKGLIDRLTLRQAQLNLIQAEQQLSSAQFETLNAAHQIENAMQAPLFDQKANQSILPEANSP